MSIASACLSRYISHTAKLLMAESTLPKQHDPFSPLPFKGNIGSLCIHIVFVHLDLIDDTIPSLLVQRSHAEPFAFTTLLHARFLDILHPTAQS